MTEKGPDHPLPWTRRLVRSLPLAVSLLLLALLLSRFSGRHLLMEIQGGWLLSALLFSLALNLFFGAYKWRLVMGLSNIRVPYGQVLRLWTGLMGMSFFMPFQSGHILYALALKKSRNLGYVASFESVGYDKYLNIVGTAGLIALGQLLVDSGHVLSAPWIGPAAGAMLLFYFLDHHALRLFSSIEAIRKRSRLIGQRQGLRKKAHLLLIAMIYQSSDVITFYLACRSLGISFDTFFPVAVFPVILLLTYIPVTFSGIGAREGLLALLMTGALGYDQGIAVGLVIDFVEYIIPAVIGLLFLPPLLRLFSGKGEEST